MLADKREFESKFKLILEKSKDSHNIFTPFELCDNALSAIPSLDGNILVIANMEFIYTLLRKGVAKHNIYFASPCDIKCSVVAHLIPKDNIFTYQQLITKEDVRNMDFDVVVMNPPWQLQLPMRFMEMAVQIAPIVVCISDATWITSPIGSSRSREFRQQVSQVAGFKSVELLPIGAFTKLKANGKIESVLKVTCITVQERGYTGETTFTRHLPEHTFQWTDNINGTDRDMNMYYDEMGLSVWDKSSEFTGRFDLTRDIGVGEETGQPCVYMSSKTNLAYFQREREALQKVGTPRWKLMSSTQCDPTGTAVPRNANKPKSQNRWYIFPTNTAQQATNLYRWMMSRTFCVLMTMTSTQQNVASTNLGKLPMVVLDEDYDTDAEFETAAQDALGLTTEQRTWIRTFGLSHD